MSAELRMELDQGATDPVLRVAGEIDVFTAPMLQDERTKALASCGASLVLDLRDVTFLDSTGLGVLITGLKRCRSAGGDLTLVTEQANVLKVFEITGLTTVFSIHPTVDAALA